MGRSLYADELDHDMAENKREFLLRELYDLLVDKRLIHPFLYDENFTAVTSRIKS